MTPPDPPSPRRRRVRRALLAAALALPLLAWAERAGVTAAARRILPTGEAEWIWAEWAAGAKTPAVFHAARDFELDAAPSGGRLMVLADEEHVLWVNGRRIGAGHYRTGRPLDVYPATELLQPGVNRILVELRSARGAGGFIARLEDGDGHALLVTDRSWLVFRRHRPGLVRGWEPLEEGPAAGEPAFSWGSPPVGRWDAPRPGPPRPPLDERTGRAVRPRRVAGDPAGVRKLYDFGRVVTGYLRLEHRPVAEVEVALLFAGDRPPDPRAHAQGAVLLMPDGRAWLDARPRRFRYVLLLGAPSVVGARVFPVSGEEATTAARPEPPEGAFGLAPPPLRAPIEDEVRRELKGVPRVAGREEL
ncbi:MAG TPA: hypothetical protein VNJ70_09270 [Thermoanaerobaculia bacterium]|nr:hypothetical protein [Thermoanaerobaculia bacterium]